jgi:hypothetical protein
MLGLEGIGLVSPSQLSAFRSTVDTILRHQGGGASKSARGGAGAFSDLDRLRQLVREQPLLLDALEPILSDQVIDQLLSVDPEHEEGGHEA